ncbi:MAG: C1 family peptidase [Dehalococcoidia bacterium]
MRRLDGYLKDPYSEKDLPAKNLLRGARVIMLPEVFDCVKTPPLLDQGQTSECVAFGDTLIRRIHELVELGSYPDFDPHLLYRRCKEKDGIPHLPGTYPRVALDIMLKEGMPVRGYESKSIFPCMAPSKFHPGYKIGGYWRVRNESDPEIKEIIFRYGPLSVGSTWYDEWMGMRVATFPDPRTAGGGHHYVIGGWGPNGWRVLNSWGPDWGYEGTAYMPYEMFREYVLPEGDVWKLLDTVTANRAFRL